MPAIEIEGLDHLVLTVRDIDRTCDFYERLLGMRRTPLSRVAAHLEARGIEINAGPVERSAAEGPIGSLYW